MLATNRGEGKFGLIVLIIIVSAGIYIGFKWGFAAWDAGEFREDVNESVIYWSSHGAPVNANIVIEIRQKAEANGIDLYEEDIVIERSENFLMLSIYWETPLEFPGEYTYYLPFTIEREIRTK
jgi:hypothetical protein